MKRIIGVLAVLVVSCFAGCKKENSNSAVTDADGNVYHTITICNQTWLIENLKTTHYRDGSPITDGNDSLTWVSIQNNSTQTGAWCNVYGNAANTSTYGKLYNWYAVADTRGISPNGWHVPSKAELDVLISCLGGVFSAGGKMKSVDLWQFPNYNADDSSGFHGLPSGERFHGHFDYFGYDGWWWLATESDSSKGWWYGMSYNGPGTTLATDNKNNGISVRCIKD